MLADVNAQGRQYGNALQAASVGGHLEIVEILLEKGADINVPGGGYSSALHAAWSRKAWAPRYAEVIAALLKAGANDNVEESESE
ncbi:hypothetical protein D9758_015201 [Tetrapyrgos nigripes]|uniref:Uncharacterized protein n=1 Tax=Tetrapyrgos nigripes TaxID=182062 RepID=A0A8H5CLR7_9AGAR|nr:hypothetical protein D9758_015201 [Tetrapyrgos nigripes]